MTLEQLNEEIDKVKEAIYVSSSNRAIRELEKRLLELIAKKEWWESQNSDEHSG